MKQQFTLDVHITGERQVYFKSINWKFDEKYFVL